MLQRRFKYGVPGSGSVDYVKEGIYKAYEVMDLCGLSRVGR